MRRLCLRRAPLSRRTLCAALGGPRSSRMRWRGSPRTTRGTSWPSSGGAPSWQRGTERATESSACSFNFTRAAQEKNAENLLVVHEPALAARYAENWLVHAAHSEAYTAK